MAKKEIKKEDDVIVTKPTAKILGSNNEPLGIEPVSIGCQHTDLLPKGSDKIEVEEESDASNKSKTAPGIHAGKKAKFSKHEEE